jgi:hypothetical protein
MVIPPMAGRRETAVQYYRASEHARMIAEYWARNFNLQVEPQRAKMFGIPGGSTRKTGLKDAIYALQVLVGVRPPGFMKPVVESKSSLIGESAYSAFLNDTFINGYGCDPNDPTCEPAVPARFTSDKARLLGDPSRMNMSSDIGKLIDSGLGLGGPILATACCCCCSCCSVCCCSSNDGDQQTGDVEVAAIPHGDPRAGNLPETEFYYRGMMAVMPNGEAIGVILHGRSSDMAVESMSIAYVDAPVGTVGEVKQVGFDPNRLVEIGPEAMAKEIFR